MNVLIILLLIFNVTVNAMKISLNNFVYIFYGLTKSYVVYVNKICSVLFCSVLVMRNRVFKYFANKNEKPNDSRTFSRTHLKYTTNY